MHEAPYGHSGAQSERGQAAARRAVPGCQHAWQKTNTSQMMPSALALSWSTMERLVAGASRVRAGGCAVLRRRTRRHADRRLGLLQPLLYLLLELAQRPAGRAARGAACQPMCSGAAYDSPQSAAPACWLQRGDSAQHARGTARRTTCGTCGGGRRVRPRAHLLGHQGVFRSAPRVGAHRGSYVAGVSILDSTRRVAAASTACRHKGASRERAGRSSAVQLHECCAWPRAVAACGGGALLGLLCGRHR
jgi:hypothetical protein